MRTKMFQVKIQSGYTGEVRKMDVRVGEDQTEAEAMRQAEETANEGFWIAPSRMQEWIAEQPPGDYQQTKVDWVVPLKKAVALSAQPMREIYVNGGYCSIPA